MRSSSSGHKSLRCFLAALCLFEWGGAAWPCLADDGKPVLLLKYSGRALSDDAARERFSPITAEIGKRLDPRSSIHSRVADTVGIRAVAEIDDATLNAMGTRVADAGRRMDRLENREAGRELAALEKELRGYRLGDATRPLVADVFMKLGTLSLWEGNVESATGYLRKARSIRNDFVPDPALYSPQFRRIWDAIGGDLPSDADILVESVPPGARVYLDDSDRGTTPLRLKVPASRPVRLRLEHAGFKPLVESRQWLPGDSERIELLLPGDRDSRLAGFLEGGAPEIAEAGAIVSEIMKDSGTERVAFLVLDAVGGREELRVLAAKASSPTPRLVGRIPLFDGPEKGPTTGERVADLLAGEGWPIRPRAIARPGRPWYYSWWFLTGAGLLAAGTAAAFMGGGGGGGASSTSTSGVNF